jgi:hypothetical protein
MNKNISNEDGLFSLYEKIKGAYLDGINKAATEEDRKSIINGKLKIDIHLNQMLEILDFLGEKDRADLRERGRLCLYEIASGAFAVGSAGIITAGAVRRLEADRAKDMRKALAAKRAGAEKALLDAIDAERGNGKSHKPSKEGAAILSDVNKRLQLAGLDPVSVDSITRRLKKFPRY